MLLMIDNYDSFTYNIVQYLRELGADVQLLKNDACSLDDIVKLSPSHIVISPGPGTPDNAGVSLALIRRFMSDIPILGVCLGHQCIAQALGGKVVSAQRVMHGKTSVIHHNGAGLFRGLSDPFVATRYHSLVVDKFSLSADFEVGAWTFDKSSTDGERGQESEIMALSHKKHPLYGVQFHPEAILSECGHHILNNFLAVQP